MIVAHLSIIEKPARHGKSYDAWLGKENQLSNRDRLRLAIDQALQKKPRDLDALIQLLEQDGYQVKRGKHIALKLEEQQNYIRLRSLGGGYSEEELLDVIRNNSPHTPFIKRKYPKPQHRITLLVQLEEKLYSNDGYWYRQAMKVIEAKQISKTLLFVQEHGYKNANDLSQAATNMDAHYQELRTKIKKAETRMDEIKNLRTQILNYIKTRDVYAYRSEHPSGIIARADD